MLQTVALAAEVAGVVAGWAIVLVTVYRWSRARLSPTLAIDVPAQNADGARSTLGGGLGLAMVVGLAAFTVVAILDVLHLGGGPSLIDAGGGWCIATILLRRVRAGRRAAGELGAPVRDRPLVKQKGRKFPVIPVVVANVLIPVICILYHHEGKPAAEMVLVAMVAFVVMNSIALLTWRFGSQR